MPPQKASSTSSGSSGSSSSASGSGNNASISQHIKKFYGLLCDGGLNLPPFNEIQFGKITIGSKKKSSFSSISSFQVKDAMLLRRHIEKEVARRTKTDIENFCFALKSMIEDEYFFCLCLVPLESTNEGNYEEELYEQWDKNIPKLIISQMRWLDLIVDSKKLTEHLNTLLQISSIEFTKELISAIPEIIDDSEHDNIVEKLDQVMQDKSEMTTCVIDALSNLNLKKEILNETIDRVLRNLNSASLSDLPVIIRFLLQSTNDDNIKSVVQGIRKDLDISSLGGNNENDENDLHDNDDDNENDNNTSLILSGNNSTFKGKGKTTTMIDEQDEEFYSTQQQKRKGKQFIDSNNSSSSSSSSLQCESLLVSAISTGIRHRKIIENVKNDYNRQKIIQSLITHVGSNSKIEKDSSLDVLLSISYTKLSILRNYSSFFQVLIDSLTNLTDQQLRKVYKLFSILSFTKTLNHSNNNNTRTRDELMIIIRKQLSNTNFNFKKMGIIGSCTILSIIGSNFNQFNNLNNLNTSNISNNSNNNKTNNLLNNYNQQNLNNEEYEQCTNTTIIANTTTTTTTTMATTTNTDSKKKKKKKSDEDDQDDNDEEQDEDEQENETTTTSSKSSSEYISLPSKRKYLSNLKIHYRELDLSVINIIKYNNNATTSNNDDNNDDNNTDNNNSSLQPVQLFYIIEDLQSKLKSVIARSKTTFFTSKEKENHYNLNRINTNDFYEIANRQVQTICIDRKLSLNKSLAKIIPKIKKDLESCNLKTKVILKQNGVENAITISVITDRDVTGKEASSQHFYSQLIDSSSSDKKKRKRTPGDDENDENDENEEEVQHDDNEEEDEPKKKKKKSEKKKKKKKKSEENEDNEEEEEPKKKKKKKKKKSDQDDQDDDDGEEKKKKKKKKKKSDENEEEEETEKKKKKKKDKTESSKKKKKPIVLMEDDNDPIEQVFEESLAAESPKETMLDEDDDIFNQHESLEDFIVIRKSNQEDDISNYDITKSLPNEEDFMDDEAEEVEEDEIEEQEEEDDDDE
ncbi:predicted protein [Naegleria gruberi]|uniref:Predicted protein n=1 Tax=Naegleria gruberi TaxID=5762 RepID=D2UXB1_NAEGR|nr:uncharacterized protein NAEGRDRAFT_61701 [Naegleria gruberi]EFC50893.1 predicted protein [Naegleria gruberi]|eukprot:XP_002683637.1 predicted protein [Naegleria gruberi strain NEG-M]